MNTPHIVLFDLNAGGHHGQYVKQLAQFWCARTFRGRLSIMVTSSLLKKHSDLVGLVEQCDRADIRELPECPSSGNLVQISRMQGQILKNSLNELKPTHCLLLDFDLFQLPLAFGLRFKFPVSISGIYFRPFLHHKDLVRFRTGLGGFARLMRKRSVLAAALRNPHFKYLFSLDPYFAEEYRSSTVRVLSLPDGIEPQVPSVSPSETRREWGVESGRRLAFFFGSLAKRKGVIQTLDAVRLLSCENQSKLCLALVGTVALADQTALMERLDILNSSSRVQLVKALRFVSDTEMINLFSASDLVLLPYQRHVGSSGILVRAAQAGKPVLGSNYGLIGRYICDFGLGIAIDSSISANIASGLSQWLESPRDFPFDAKRASAFGKHHTASRFSEVIFGQIYDQPS